MTLAARLNTASSYIGEIEIGRKFPSVEMIDRIAAALKIEPYELFKSEDGLSPSMATVLSKWGDEISEAVSKTLENIRKQYV
ncbi:hypothetical protein AGMMS50212_02280 [Spirochaetia bacterium]|nr:hypothetical protein AGMMS50212_02280 [Spirochaetia bacterium]